MKTHTSKTKTWLKSIVLLPLLAILIYSFSTKKEIIENSSNSVANSNTFTITIEKDNNEIKLSCLEGCAWKELTFKDTQNNSNIIDFYGVSSEKSDDNSDFAFIVESKNNGVNLKSLKGTAWTDLSFTLSSDGKQVIDKNGMVTLKTKNNSYPSSKTDEKQTEIPKLELKQNPLKLILNGKETSLNTLKDDFSKVTNGQKSDLFIDSKGVNIKIETLEKITKEIEINLVKAILSDGVVHDSSKTELIKNDNGSISFKSLQKGASKEQIAEYNKLAKYYNSQKGSDYTIKLSDMKRLKYLYELMTEEQRKSAEPFPNFPPPPPPAPAPESVSKKERAEYESMAKKAKAGKAYSYKYKDDNGKTITVHAPERDMSTPPPPPPPVPADATPEQKKQYKKAHEEYYKKYKVENGKVSERIPPPPPPPVPADATPEQKEKYQKISEEYYKNYKVENGKVSERVPPPPPPKSPLDHVIDMAKKGATFYYKGKQISSDKAIEILKTDKSMNISTKNSNSKNPKVYLSKEPITIKNK